MMFIVEFSKFGVVMLSLVLLDVCVNYTIFPIAIMVLQKGGFPRPFCTIGPQHPLLGRVVAKRSFWVLCGLCVRSAAQAFGSFEMSLPSLLLFHLHSFV